MIPAGGRVSSGRVYEEPRDVSSTRTLRAAGLCLLAFIAAGPTRAAEDVEAAFKGKTIGVQVSTIHANFVNENFKDVATIKEYKTTDDRDLDLKSGRVDAILDDQPTVAAMLAKPDAADLTAFGPGFTGGAFGVGAGMGIRKSDADLTAMFDKALKEAFADGSVKKYSLKWFKIDTTP